MHCDDKRTKYALEQYIEQATIELDELKKQLNVGDSKKTQVRISNLEQAISDTKEQLSKIN